jgi:hypothetical protein
MDLERVEFALGKIEVGLTKYLNLMDQVHKVDVSEDNEFQKRYNGFYRMRQRKPIFYKDYFDFMEANKNKGITYNEVLNHFYEKFGRIEASFSSKLLATINPNMPVWDEFVLQNLNLKKPTYSDKNRLNKTIDLYSQISKWYDEFLASNESEEMLTLFNKRYPNTNITNVKKIDLILWQMR